MIKNWMYSVTKTLLLFLLFISFSGGLTGDEIAFNTFIISLIFFMIVDYLQYMSKLKKEEKK